MIMKIKCFGIARDLTQTSTIVWDSIDTGITVAQLRDRLAQEFPSLKSIKSYMIAVNQEYALDSQVLSDQDEIAIIPPVSGG